MGALETCTVFSYLWAGVRQSELQAYLGDTAGLAPGHCNKANNTIKQVKWILGFPSGGKSYIYTVVY